MTVNFEKMTEACLSAFGQAFSFARIVSVSRFPAADPATVQGILMSGVELEEYAALDGSVSAGIWIKDGALDPPLQAGDEIEGPEHIYKILRPKADREMIFLPLRQDRPVIR